MPRELAATSWRELVEKIKLEHDPVEMLALCNKLSEMILAEERETRAMSSKPNLENDYGWFGLVRQPPD